MPLHAIRPGQRKGNKTWLFRGRIGGKLVEVSSALTAQASAREVREAQAEAEREAWAQHEARRVPQPGEATTFRVAAKHYLNWRDPNREHKIRRNRHLIEDVICPYLGDRVLSSITPADIIELANTLYPGTKPSTRNTNVIIPAAAVLHYAAKNRWCPHIIIPQFKLAKPRNRDVSDDVAEVLIKSLPKGSYRRLLMLWLFRQGDRISDALAVRWEQINLTEQSVRSWIDKPDEERERMLHDEVFEALAAIPVEEQEGYVFPWRHRTSVYVWLTPYRKKLGVYFTPHMARHTVGRQLNAGNIAPKTAMEIMGHKDIRSTLRYQGVDKEAVRAALHVVGKKRQKRGEGVGKPNKPAIKTTG